MKNRIEVGKSYKNKTGDSVEIIYRLANTSLYCYIGIVNEEEIRIYKESGKSSGDDIVFEPEYKLRDIVILKNGQKVVITSIYEEGGYNCVATGLSSKYFAINLDASEIARKATKEEAECPYQDGELCLVRFRPELDWNLRFSNGAGEFYTDQNIEGYTVPFEEHKSAYPLTNLPDTKL